MMLKTALSAYHQHKKPFLTFLAVGLGTTSLYWGCFALLWYVIHTHHVIAVSVAFTVSASYQFLINRKVTFKVRDTRFAPQIGRYLSVLAVNYLLSVYIMQFSLSFFSSALLGLILTSAVTPVTGYLLLRYWVFRHLIPI